MSDEHLDPEYADDELEDIAQNDGAVLEESDIPVVGDLNPEGIANYDATTGSDYDDPDAVDITESDGPDLEAGDDLS